MRINQHLDSLVPTAQTCGAGPSCLLAWVGRTRWRSIIVLGRKPRLKISVLVLKHPWFYTKSKLTIAGTNSEISDISYMRSSNRTIDMFVNLVVISGPTMN